MKFSFTSSSLLLLLVATPSALVVAKKAKEMNHTKNKSLGGSLLGGGPNSNYDSMSPYDDGK